VICHMERNETQSRSLSLTSLCLSSSIFSHVSINLWGRSVEKTFPNSDLNPQRGPTMQIKQRKSIPHKGAIPYRVNIMSEAYWKSGWRADQEAYCLRHLKQVWNKVIIKANFTYSFILLICPTACLNTASHKSSSIGRRMGILRLYHIYGLQIFSPIELHFWPLLIYWNF
jgi:hypothetical protein